ncbi:MAG TPA: MlaD family protein, partial [Terricaulis sp.]|nr:MlaD family protein [Terricaulis sp.]
METKANYVRIGAAVVLGVLLTMMFAAWISSGDLRRGANEYDIVFDDPVRGLTEGGEVRFNGIKVGEVRNLRIDPDDTNRVIARVRISRDVPVREDSEGQLEPIGLTGVTLIQLTRGSGDELRPSGFGPPPQIRGRGSQIDQIVARGEEIVMRASEAMAAVRDLLTDENIARVTRIISNLETVSAQLADTQSVISRSGEAAGAITVAANDFATLTRQLQSDLRSLDETMTEINDAAAVASGETLPELTRAADEIRR